MHSGSQDSTLNSMKALLVLTEYISSDMGGPRLIIILMTNRTHFAYSLFQRSQQTRLWLKSIMLDVFDSCSEESEESGRKKKQYSQSRMKRLKMKDPSLFTGQTNRYTLLPAEAVELSKVLTRLCLPRKSQGES